MAGLVPATRELQDGPVNPCRNVAKPANQSIEAALVELALKLSGERTREAVVIKALAEFVARRRQQRMLDLMGALDWDPSCDYRAERSRK